MEKIPAKSKSNKGKTKKPSNKTKTTKKKKNDGPTCSTFLAELSKKLAAKKRDEEENPHNVVQTIIDSITNALPMKFSKKSPPKMSAVKMETLQAIAPELMTRDVIDIPPVPVEDIEMETTVTVESVLSATTSAKGAFRMPRMPLVSSEVFKSAVQAKREQIQTEDIATSTGDEHDMANELAKHVNTLKKISLIAEEFNQKTAKNLKEIVDSVQEDLMKKMEEIRTEQKKAKARNQLSQEE